MPMRVSKSNDLETLIEFEILDAAGSPAKIDGDPEWTATPDGRVRLLTTDQDGNPLPKMQRAVWPENGTVGDVEIMATADADLGSGVRTLGAEFDFTFTEAEGRSAELVEVGTSVPKRANP